MDKARTIEPVAQAQCEVSDAALARIAQSGDRAAFDQLGARYRPALVALAFMRTSDREEAEDLAQEALARAWEHLPTLNNPGAFLPWLRAIMANSCATWIRHRIVARRRVYCISAQPGLVDPRPLPQDALLKRERDRDLRDALAGLPEANRTALLMHVWGGASYEEIAAFIGVQVTTIEGRIFRAKQRLRRLLNSRDEMISEPKGTGGYHSLPHKIKENNDDLRN